MLHQVQSYKRCSNLEFQSESEINPAEINFSHSSRGIQWTAATTSKSRMQENWGALNTLETNWKPSRELQLRIQFECDCRLAVVQTCIFSSRCQNNGPLAHMYHYKITGHQQQPNLYNNYFWCLNVEITSRPRPKPCLQGFTLVEWVHIWFDLAYKQI